MSPPLRFLLLLSITVLAPSGAKAGVEGWIPVTGPEGQGATYFLAVRPTYPSQIFAWTGTGRLFRSSDAAATNPQGQLASVADTAAF